LHIVEVEHGDPSARTTRRISQLIVEMRESFALDVARLKKQKWHSLC